MVKKMKGGVIMDVVFTKTEKKETTDVITDFTKKLNPEQQERLYGFILAAKFLETDKEQVS